ncbi:DUF3817 domain-containing protein [Sediminibacillus dalangtanensis]|uniref:DUF3817 domain-containing protein n=1 Tax=Sediminibacillus dalangtanensis TaxID=2729421 RepID=A0ABX7VPZ9_9BACI|nr:DUF3817 domain-containing protein [Sediminibacillus dalangtanensis]QTM98034.1 DUF3817 domain-containing protein [Sediminibacillus dalangtanensis]
MLNSPIRLFRIFGMIEGTSLVILLFIAMPLKYIAGFPEVVTLVGSLHGFFFIVYLLVIAYTTFKIRWAFRWLFGSLLVAFIPFGNYVLDYRLQKSRYV